MSAVCDLVRDKKADKTQSTISFKGLQEQAPPVRAGQYSQIM